MEVNPDLLANQDKVHKILEGMAYEKKDGKLIQKLLETHNK
jgi:hypothetical protein